MIRVGRLNDNSLHGYQLNNGNVVNIVRDCDNNFIVSEKVLNWILEELPNTIYEEIDWCPIIIEEEFE